jgi:hypothetical protein
MRRRFVLPFAPCTSTAAALLAGAVLAGAGALSGCRPAAEAVPPASVGAEWREFQGTWTAAGSRHVILLGTARRASVATFHGTLLLTGTDRPAAGFRADAVVFNDTETGLLGRAVWTDENGNEAWSELRGDGTGTGNRIEGRFIGGTGRFAGLTGDYAFSWRFVLESEDGIVQGQSAGLRGRVRIGAAAGAAR